MIKNNKSAIVALWITSIIWGTGFVGTDFAINTGASTLLITTMRFTLATLILLVVLNKRLLHISKETFKVGSLAGVFLFFGFTLQTYGQSLTTVSNSSFITSTTVIMVPFIVWIIDRKKPETKYFFLAILAMIGACVLTVDFSSGFKFNTGDIIVLISAASFAVHISYLGKCAKNHNPTHLTFLQLCTVAVLAFVCLTCFEFNSIQINIIEAAIPSTLYLAIFSSCLCYYMQTTAQQYTKSSKAALILCMEGLFGSLFAIILGIDLLSINVIIGGICILAAVILAEI